LKTDLFIFLSNYIKKIRKMSDTTSTEKPKRIMTEEQKAKLKAGRLEKLNDPKWVAKQEENKEKREKVKGAEKAAKVARAAAEKAAKLATEAAEKASKLSAEAEAAEKVAKAIAEESGKEKPKKERKSKSSKKDEEEGSA
jgi:hypothetical protein